MATALATAMLAVAAGCGDEGSDGNGPRLSGQDAEVAATYKRYLAALNSGDGATVCQLLVPAGTEKLRPPAKRESCAEAVSDSIGHPGPGGLRWRSAKLTGRPEVDRSKRTATLFVNVASTYTDGPTDAESGAVKLQRSGSDWLLTEPDAVLYHAIGQS